jgi:hypothetical protein
MASSDLWPIAPAISERTNINLKGLEYTHFINSLRYDCFPWSVGTCSGTNKTCLLGVSLVKANTLALVRKVSMWFTTKQPHWNSVSKTCVQRCKQILKPPDYLVSYWSNIWFRHLSPMFWLTLQYISSFVVIQTCLILWFLFVLGFCYTVTTTTIVLFIRREIYLGREYQF